jgi:hypothetical protein
MRFSPLIAPLFTLGLFSFFILFSRPLIDPSPFLSFFFFEVASFTLVPLDIDRFALAIAKRASFFSFITRAYICTICLFFVFINRFV